MAISNRKQSNWKEGFQQRWARRFRDFAERYDDDARIAGWSRTGLQQRLRTFASLWSPDRPNTNWLDVGCGAGTYCRYIAKYGINIVGLDYSIVTLQKAKARGTESITWVGGDATRLPLRPSNFDGVVCFGVTQALPDSQALVQEIVRVLKPGGQIWLDGLNARCIPHIWERFRRWIKNRPCHLRYEYPEQMVELLREEELSEIQTYWLPIFPAKWQSLQWIGRARVMRWFLRHVPFFGSALCHGFMISGVRQ